MKYLRLAFEIPQTRLSRRIHIILILITAIVVIFYLKRHEIPFWQLSLLLAAMCGQEFFLNTRGNKEYFAAENRYKLYAIHQLLLFSLSMAVFFVYKLLVDCYWQLNSFAERIERDSRNIKKNDKCKIFCDKCKTFCTFLMLLKQRNKETQTKAPWHANCVI